MVNKNDDSNQLVTTKGTSKCVVIDQNNSSDSKDIVPNVLLQKLGSISGIPKISIYKNFVKAATLIFIVSLFIPSFSEIKFIFFRTEYTIISRIFEWLSDEQYYFFAGSSLFFIIIPIYKLGVLWSMSSPNIYLSSSQLYRLYLANNYGKWVDLGVFLVVIFNLSLSLGAFFFGISLLIINILIGKYFIVLETLIVENNENIKLERARRSESLKLRLNNLFRNLIRFSIVLVCLSIAFKFISPYITQPTNEILRLQSTQSKESKDNSTVTDKNAPSVENHEDAKARYIQQVINGIDVNNGNFDVGNYCIRHEKLEYLTFKECIGIAMIKIGSMNDL